MKIAHIGIVVKDLKISADFYINILGFKKIGEFDDERLSFIYLSNDGDVIELLKYKITDNKLRNYGTIDHLAFNVQDLDKEIKYLKEHQIELAFDQPRFAIGGKRIMFFYGPDRERIEYIEE